MERSSDDAFEADAELQATNFVLARPGKPAWDDPRLAVTLSAKGQLDGKTLKRLDTTTIEIASGTDDFTATLVSPVAEPSAAAAWPFDAHLRGELDAPDGALSPGRTSRRAGTSLAKRT